MIAPASSANAPTTARSRILGPSLEPVLFVGAGRLGLRLGRPLAQAGVEELALGGGEVERGAVGPLLGLGQAAADEEVVGVVL